MTTCERCGSPNAPDSRVCGACGALFAAAVTTSAGDTAFWTEYASFWQRVGAVLIDALILLVPSAILQSATNVFIAQLAQFAYFVYFTGSTGQTLGKKLLNIKVVRADGGPMDFGVAAMREIVGKFISSIILGIGYLFPLWDQRKQALHDKIASTLVVRTTPS